MAAASSPASSSPSSQSPPAAAAAATSAFAAPPAVPLAFQLPERSQACCPMPCHHLGTIPLRNYTVLKIVFFLGLAYASFWYALLIGAELKDSVRVTYADIWPALLMFIAMFFIPRWDGSDSYQRYASAFTPQRRNGLIDQGCCRLLVGGGLFIGGGLWQLGIIIHRFIAPLPSQDKPISTLPGYLLLIELFFICLTAYTIFEYVAFASRSHATLASSEGEA